MAKKIDRLLLLDYNLAPYYHHSIMLFVHNYNKKISGSLVNFNPFVW